MSARITLTAVRGGLQGQQFVLTKPGQYLVGRAEDCDICLAGDLPGISRHHCALTVDPPGLSLRDLGSRNGTYINGELIGRRALAEPLDESLLDESFTDYTLDDGDEIRLARLVFRVGVHAFGKVPQHA